jgi:hypothetical protein
MKKIIVFFFIALTCSANAQLDATINVNSKKDSTTKENPYYTSHTDKFLLKFMNAFKYTKLDVKNTNDQKSLKLQPAGNLDLGLAFNYKWLGFGFTVGLPSSEEADLTKGKTKRFDMQLSIYSKWVVVDAFYQKYRGFHLTNAADFRVEEDSTSSLGVNNFANSAILPQLPNMNSFSFGASAYYILNHKRLSYRAAYVRNETQNRSAGSLLFGPFLSIDGASTKNGFVPDILPSTVKDSFDISFYRSTTYGLALGYTYSVVIAKKVFMNFSMIPGIGIKDIKTELNGIERASKKGATVRFAYRFAAGYEHKSFLIGLILQGSVGTIPIDNFEFSPGVGLLNLYLGKRFDLKKIMKKRKQKKQQKSKVE